MPGIPPQIIKWDLVSHRSSIYPPPCPPVLCRPCAGCQDSALSSARCLPPGTHGLDRETAMGQAFTAPDKRSARHCGLCSGQGRDEGSSDFWEAWNSGVPAGGSVLH